MNESESEQFDPEYNKNCGSVVIEDVAQGKYEKITAPIRLNSTVYVQYFVKEKVSQIYN